MKLTRINEVYMKATGEASEEMELRQFLTFMVPGYKFTPAYKSGYWDGKIRLYNTMTKTVYTGLFQRITQWAEENGFSVELDPDLAPMPQISPTEAQTFFQALHLPYEVRDYQEAAFRACTSLSRALVLMPTGCHAAGDKVYSEDKGWINVEDVVVGDRLLTPDGNFKNVIRLYQGEDDMYEIKPMNNRPSITVNGNHILHLKHTDSCKPSGYCKGNRDTVTHMSVRNYLKASNSFKHVSVSVYNDKSYEGKEIDLGIDPYFVGLYLGDGHSHGCAITNIEPEINEFLTSYAESMNCTTRVREKITTSIKGNGWHNNHILNGLRKLGINVGQNLTCATKRIPTVCFEMAKEQRLALLAGLIDTDGHLSKGSNYEIVSASDGLADDIVTLAIGLGLIAYKKVKFDKRYNKEYHRVIIMGNIHIVPCRVPRKKAVAWTARSNRNPYNSKFEITSKGKGKFYGFEIEDHLYVTHGGMITHNSGKSLSIYTLARFYNVKTLIIVPTLNLIEQMCSDFGEYGYKENIHKIFSGQEKESDCLWEVSTWQSLYKMPKSHFDKYQLIIVDEAHTAKAESIKKILEKMPACPYRFGFTGTLDGSKTNEMVLEGLFGPTLNVVKTHELIDQGYLARMKMSCLLLKYPEAERKAFKRDCTTYDAEMKFITSHQRRNQMIARMAGKAKGSSLVIFHYLDHGRQLYELVKENTKHPVFYISGEIDGHERERIRKFMIENENAIIVGSRETISFGLNIPGLKNIFLTSPSKARIKLLQSIGRGLRKIEGKTEVSIFDIADDLSWKKGKNYTLLHFMERIRIFSSEKFKFKIHNLEI